MSFLLRLIFVVGLIYAISPTRPGVPYWIEKSISVARATGLSKQAIDQAQSAVENTITLCAKSTDPCMNADRITGTDFANQGNLKSLLDGLSEDSLATDLMAMAVPIEPESTGSIASNVPLPPRRSPEVSSKKKI